MASTDIQFTGLSHMANQVVEVVIAGLDCGTFTVSATGTVTVPLSSNPSLSGAYLQSLDVGPYDKTTYGDATTQITLQVSGGGVATVYVPVNIGFPYFTFGQKLRAASEAQTKSPSGGATGKQRRAWSYGALLSHTQGISFGTSIATLTAAPLKFADGTVYPNSILYDGVVYDTLKDSDSFDGMVCWAIPGPYPCILMSLTSFIETKER